MESGCRSLLCALLLLTVGAVHAQDQVAGSTAINLYGSPQSNFTSVICNTNDPTVGFADRTPATPLILAFVNSTSEFSLGTSYNLRETPQTGYAYTSRLSVIAWGGTPISFGCGSSANINLITGAGIGTLSTESIGLTAGNNTYNETDVIPPVYCTAAVGAPENNAFHLNVSLANGEDLYFPRMSDPINYAIARSRHSTGTYVCTASNQFNNGVVRRVDINLIVQFQPDFTGTTLRHELNQGERLTIVCNVAAFPELTALTSTAPNGTVTDQLSKLPSTNPRLPRKVDVLIVPSVTQASAGNYTCGAVNSVGSTTQAVEVVVIAPPGMPRNLTAANDSSIALSWLAPASDGGKPVTGYVATCTRSNGHVVSAMVIASQLAVKISGAHPGEMYMCTVVATNQAGNGAEATVAVDILTGPPCAPSVAQNSSASSAGLHLSINIPCDGGEVLMCVLTRVPAGASVTVFQCNVLGPLVVTDTNVMGGVAYTYVVNVTNSQGFSSFMISTLMTVTTPGPTTTMAIATTPSTTGAPLDEDDDGLSGGAIAGIIVGVLIVFVIVLVIVIYLVRKAPGGSDSKPPPEKPKGQAAAADGGRGKPPMNYSNIDHFSSREPPAKSGGGEDQPTTIYSSLDRDKTGKKSEEAALGTSSTIV